RQAFVADVIGWLDELAFDRASLAGQSLGAHTAFLVSARYPERVSRLVVAEASPSPNPASQQVVRTWLEAWPIPFPTEEAAKEYFGGDTLWAEAWASGLEMRADGLWPSFDIDQMLIPLADAE